MSDFDNTCVKCGCSSWIEVCENCNEQELENKRKQGALEERNKLFKRIKYRMMNSTKDSSLQMEYVTEYEVLEKLLKELKKVGCE